jgi:cell division protein FtsB
MKLDRWKTVVLTVIAASLLVYIFSPNFLRLARVYHQIRILEDEIQRLQLQNQEYQESIYSLKNDPAYAEKVAREELGMSKAEEIIYKFEEEPEKKEETP